MMLKIWFGDREDVKYGPMWFKNNFDIGWFKDPFVQAMIEDVDQSRYVDGYIIESPVFGPIPPQMLSGGVQTLIMIYKRSDLIFDATSCGGNCAKWLQKIGELQDVTVNLNYLMRFKDPFEAEICNENKIIHSYNEYLHLAIQYV